MEYALMASGKSPEAQREKADYIPVKSKGTYGLRDNECCSKKNKGKI